MDRNFDDLFERFHKNIKRSDKGRLRGELIREDLEGTVFGLDMGGLSVLDSGCGLGDISVWLAAKGHKVMATDISQKMVDFTLQTAREESLASYVKAERMPVQEALSAGKSYDLICIHAVMEWLDKPYEILDLIPSALNEGGYISLTVYNLHRTIFNGLIKGDFYKILKGEFGGDSIQSMTPPNPIEPERVISRLSELGFTLELHAGLRCFYDFITPEVRDKRNYEQILQLERRYRKQSPYRDIARYVHILARKP
ncbi:MAG: methyltransferase domain-containing protein [Proteobacteria bacterium]|nr:MAG: methyltransferase domain-containing protein [Pseudomonadota bacterium]